MANLSQVSHVRKSFEFPVMVFHDTWGIYHICFLVSHFNLNSFNSFIFSLSNSIFSRRDILYYSLLVRTYAAVSVEFRKTKTKIMATANRSEGETIVSQ